MNNFIRPSLYSSDHQIFPVKNKKTKQKYEVVVQFAKVAIFLKRIF